jgi:hypothetical protein
MNIFYEFYNNEFHIFFLPPPMLEMYDQPICLLNTLKPEEKGVKIQANQEGLKLVGIYQILLCSSYVTSVSRTHTDT